MTICHNVMMSPVSSVPKLQLDDISHRFGSDGVAIFEHLTLSVMPRSVVSIIGTSGVGKTTLFDIAAGLLRPSTGQVLIDGMERTGLTGQVGYMLQKDLLLSFKRVYDNIALPLTLQGKDKVQIRSQIEPLLPIFGLDGLTDKFPHQLSGGQRQRAALLRTYLSNADLMLLDEPFSALDFVTKTEMYDWFTQFRQKQGLTCLLITHDIDEAIQLSDEIYVLKGAPAVLANHFCLPQDDDFVQSVAYLQLKQAILNAYRT